MSEYDILRIVWYRYVRYCFDDYPPPGGDEKPSVYIETLLHTDKESVIKEGIAVLIVSLETAFYAINIITIFCGVAYKIGYEHGKNAKK